MPVENTRIIVRGVPRVDRAFTVFEVSRDEAQRQAALMQRDADRCLRELRAQLRVGLRR